MLDLKELTFQRGENGNFISQEVVLETLPDKPTVKIRPVTRGKLQEIYAMATSDSPEQKVKADNELLLHGLVEPVINEEALKDIKPYLATAIVTAIMAISLGISQEDINTQTKELLSQQELDLKKN